MAACCAILVAAQAAITFNGALFPTCYGIQFAEQPRNRNTIYCRPMRFDNVFSGRPNAAAERTLCRMLAPALRPI